jgi:O-antigen/teichoic acid export membrane protein
MRGDGSGKLRATQGLARGASVTFMARSLALVIGVVSSVIVARALGPAGKGEYALIILIPLLFQTVGGLGLDQAVVYLVARRRDEASSIAATLAAASFGLGSILLAVYAGLSALAPYQRYLATSGVDAPLVWILIALLPVTLTMQVLASAILGLERYRDFNLATLVAPAANLLLLLVLVVGMDRGVGGAVLAAGGSALCGLAAAMAFLRQAAPGPIRRVPGILRDALSYGSRIHVANVAWFLHYRADMFLVSFMAGPAALGFYAAAVGLAEKLYMAPSAVGTVLFPRIASAGAEEARRVTPVASRHTFWLTLGLSLILALMAWPLVYGLYGADFLPSVLLLWLLLPGVVSLSVGRVLSADLGGRGLPGTLVMANGSMAIVNLVLNLWWIPIWGAAGAAAATSISYTAAVYLLGRRYRRESGVGWRELLRFDRAELAGAVASLTRRGHRSGSSARGPTA